MFDDIDISRLTEKDILAMAKVTWKKKVLK
jgi:hypothetical protein